MSPLFMTIRNLMCIRRRVMCISRNSRISRISRNLKIFLHEMLQLISTMAKHTLYFTAYHGWKCKHSVFCKVVSGTDDRNWKCVLSRAVNVRPTRVHQSTHVALLDLTRCDGPESRSQNFRCMPAPTISFRISKLLPMYSFETHWRHFIFPHISVE